MATIWLHISNLVYIAGNSSNATFACAQNATAAAHSDIGARLVCGKFKKGKPPAQGAGACCMSHVQLAGKRPLQASGAKSAGAA